jgi:threonine dehydrogenase-like Zn-dependent dehydrogenase
VHGVVARRGRLLVAELPEPTPVGDDALVAMRACGICGSDLHTLAHADALADVAAAVGIDDSFRPDDDYFLGHEWVAEVLDVGPDGDSAVRPGDRVVSVPYLVRGATLVPLGFSNDHYAGFCERFLLTSSLCRRVPDALDDRRAALTEPMAVGLHAVHQARLDPGDAALVVGCGPIGLALVAWLRARGVAPVVASDYSPRRRAFAAALGADVVHDPAAGPAADAAARAAAGRPLVVFEAVGVPGVLDGLIATVPAKTRVVVTGVCMQPDTIRPLLAVVKELGLQFVYAYELDEFDATLAALADGSLDVDALVTGTVGLAGVDGAFTELGRADTHVKVLVEPGGAATLAGPSALSAT